MERNFTGRSSAFNESQRKSWSSAASTRSQDALVYRAVPEEELQRAVEETVGQLLSSGPGAVASAKELIGSVEGLSLEEAVPLTARWIAELRSTAEAGEGLSAFLEKRKPKW